MYDFLLVGKFVSHFHWKRDKGLPNH